MPQNQAATDGLNVGSIRDSVIRQMMGTAIVSVDAKKKENVGDFKNNGKAWQLKGNPERVK